MTETTKPTGTQQVVAPRSSTVGREASPAARVASVEQIRAQFPALVRQHNELPIAYLDGPGGTQVPRAVVDAMAEYLLQHNANSHWAYPTSEETDAMLANARVTMAAFLNGVPTEIAFGANMTTLTLHVGRALARKWAPGDEIVVTELDHHANIDPWRAVARERGLRVRMVRVDTQRGELDWDDLTRAITGRTRLVAIGAAANAVGTINDVAHAAAIAHEHGALVFADAVHYAPHALVDVHALDCDFLACSAYSSLPLWRVMRRTSGRRFRPHIERSTNEAWRS